MPATASSTYRSTESQYKNGAREMYVTYDLAQRTRRDGARVPKVKRVYIASDVANWKVGTFAKRTGKRVRGAMRGVRIEYRQSRSAYTRSSHATSKGSDSAKWQRAPRALRRSSKCPRRPRTFAFTPDGCHANINLRSSQSGDSFEEIP